MRGRIGVAAILATLLAGWTGPSEAGMTFNIGGTFGRIGFSSFLDGGSFSGTYTVDSLPTSSAEYMTAFDLTVTDSRGSVFWHVNEADPDAIGLVGPENPRLGDLDLVYFAGRYFDTGEISLALLFHRPFKGGASVIPYNTDPDAGVLSQSSLQTEILIEVSTAPVVSGYSAVPEPSSLAMCGIAAVAGLGYARARRKAA